MQPCPEFAFYQPFLRAESVAQRAFHESALPIIVIITQRYLSLATTFHPVPLLSTHSSQPPVGSWYPW